MRLYFEKRQSRYRRQGDRPQIPRSRPNGVQKVSRCPVYVLFSLSSLVILIDVDFLQVVPSPPFLEPSSCYLKFAFLAVFAWSECAAA